MWVLIPIAFAAYGLYQYTKRSSNLWVIGDSQACGATGVGSPCGSVRPIPSNCAKSGERFYQQIEFDGVTLYVDCTVGSHTRDWTDAVLNTLGIYSGDTVIVFLGSNDYDSPINPNNIIRWADSNGIKLLWVGPPKLFEKEGKCVPVLHNALGMRYFDSRVLNLKLGDGVHPTPDEYKRWMRAVIASIR